MGVVRFLKSMEGRVVKLKEVAFVTALNIISNALFSKDLVSLEDETAVARIRGSFKTIIDVTSTPNLSDYYPFLRRLDLQRLLKKSRDSFVELCGLWQPILEERRERIKGISQQEDFLDALINDGFRDDQIHVLLAV